MKKVEEFLRNSIINYAIDNGNHTLLTELSDINYRVVGETSNLDLIQDETIRNLSPKKTRQNEKDKCCERCGNSSDSLGPISYSDNTIICSNCWNKNRKNSLQT